MLLHVFVPVDLFASVTFVEDLQRGVSDTASDG